MTWRDKRLESGSRGMKGNHPLVDQERGKRPQEAPQNCVRSQEVKGKMTPLTSFRKRTFLVAVKGSLRRASTPLTEDFQVANRSSHSIDIKREKKGYVETMIYLDNSNQR